MAGVALDAATDTQKSDASSAYKAGKASFDGGRFDEALAKFRESYGIVASPNARLMISRSLANLGNPLEAYREAQATQREAETAAATNAKYKQTATDARDDANELEKKIAIVTVSVAGDPREATLSVAGITVDRAAWSKPIPLAPGKIEIVLDTKQGAVRKSINVAAGAKANVPIEVRNDAAAAVIDKPVAEPASSEPGKKSPVRKIIGFSALGLGAAGMGMFAAFGVLSKGQVTKLDEACPTRVNCTQEVADIASRGKGYQTAANVSLTVGAVLLAAGVGIVVWDVVDSRDKPKSGALRPRLAVGPSDVTLSASF